MLVRPDENWRVATTMAFAGAWDSAVERSLITANVCSAAEYVLKKGVELHDQGIRVGAAQGDELFDLLDQLHDSLFGLPNPYAVGGPFSGWIQDLIQNQLQALLSDYLRKLAGDPAVLDRAAEWWALRLKSLP